MESEFTILVSMYNFYGGFGWLVLDIQAREPLVSMMFIYPLITSHVGCKSLVLSGLSVFQMLPTINVVML